MTTVYDVEAEPLIKKVAEDLKTKVEVPQWARFVKTSVAKERPPSNGDWWYVREASILRKLYVKGPLGVSRLRSEYRSKKNRGVKPEQSKLGGGKIIRCSLQQLEKLGYIRKASDKKGRELTPQGQSYLDKVAKEIKNG
jgi:small subunit ribosomal protein S19e